MTDRLWRVRDVAAYLDLAPRTIRWHIQTGRLIAVKLASGQWRIPEASVRAFVGQKEKDEEDQARVGTMGDPVDSPTAATD